MKNFLCAFILYFCFTSLFSQTNVLDYLSSEDKFSTFYELLELTEQDELFLSDETYTIIAPENDAFQTHYPEEVLDSLKQNGLDELTRLIKHHIVPGKIIDQTEFSETNIPLYGDPIGIFIDGAGAPIIYSSLGGSRSYIFNDYENIKLLEVYENVLINREYMLKPNLSYYPEMNRHLMETSLIDSIPESDANITMLNLRYNEDFLNMLQENGGFDNLEFIDSLLKRHILDGVYNFQNIYDGLIVKNWHGENVQFTVEGEKYFINNVEISTYETYLDASVLQLNAPGYIEPVEIISNNDEIQLKQLKVFPNPTLDEIVVLLEEEKSIRNLKLFNPNGKLLKELSNIYGSGKIDLSEMPPGIYFLSYQLDELFYTEKIVKK